MPYQVVNNIRIRYECWGVGTYPLVLLHGLGSSADDWLLQLSAFGPHFRCYTIDLRGHGLSDKPAGRYSIALFASDVIELCHALGLERVHLLGLSLGGLVAEQIAVDCPELVDKLVLLNTFPGLWPPAWQMVRTGVRRWQALARRPNMTLTAKAVAETLFPRSDQQLLREMAEERLAANDPLAYRRSIDAIIFFWPGRALERIGCPVLIVAGDRDDIVPLVYKKRLQRLLPQAEFVTIPDSGHACNLDQPDLVNDAVLRFLL